MRDGYMVIDAHAHIEVHSRTVFGGRNAQMPTDSLVAQMDSCGIDGALVIAHAWAGWTIDQYRAEHDVIANEISKHPRRLFGACWADPTLGADAVRELERAVIELGYLAVKLHPVYQRFVFDGEIVDPIIAMARQLGIPVIAHMDLRVPGCEPWRMVRLARRYPDVVFVMAHMGRDARSLQDLSFAHAARDVPNVVLEGSSTTTDAYGTFQGPAEVLGPDRVLFAADAGAFHHPAVNLLKLDLLDLERATKARILALNALRIFKITATAIDMTPDRDRGVFETAMGQQSYPVPASVIQTRVALDS
jgi:predicted TIM-barrel fold metal-dependent hydrolase